MKDISYKVALGGIVSALCLVCMFVAGIVPALYIILPMAAGILMMIIAEEVSISWGWLTYISVSLLSLFITADKEAALLFIMLFGHYPILRFYIAKLPWKVLRSAAKLIICNLCIMAFFYVTVYIFGIREMVEEMNDFGRYGGIFLLVISNVVFVLYDINLSALHRIYVKKFMPKLKKKR